MSTVLPFSIRLAAMAFAAILLWSGPSRAYENLPDLAGMWGPVQVASAEGADDAGLDHPAGIMVQKIGARVIDTIEDKDLPKDVKVQRFHEILSENLDTPVIAKFVLGRHWRRASPTQRKEYVSAFGNYIVSRYASLLGQGWKPEKFKVDRVDASRGKAILVFTTVKKANMKPVPVIFRMLKRDGRHKVVDVIVEGVSLLLAQRNEFATAIRHYGGVDGLISMMREKTF